MTLRKWRDRRPAPWANPESKTCSLRCKRTPPLTTGILKKHGNSHGKLRVLRGEKETAASYDAMSAFREALFGNAVSALRQPTITDKLWRGRDVAYAVALT